MTARDQFGNPMAGVTIDASLAFGFGIFSSVDPASAAADASGEAMYNVKQCFFGNPNNFVTFSSGGVSVTVTKAKGFFGN